jgi:hypothetical protein
MSNLVGTLPILIDESSNNGHNTIIPDNALQQDLAITKLVLGTASLCVDIAVLLPKLRVRFGGSAVDEGNVELLLNTSCLLQLVEESGLVRGGRTKCVFESGENVVLG